MEASVSGLESGGLATQFFSSGHILADAGEPVAAAAARLRAAAAAHLPRPAVHTGEQCVVVFTLEIVVPLGTFYPPTRLMNVLRTSREIAPRQKHRRPARG